MEERGILKCLIDDITSKTWQMNKAIIDSMDGKDMNLEKLATLSSDMQIKSKKLEDEAIKRMK